MNAAAHALHHRPFAALKINTWGQALAHCRMQRRLSHHDVADRAGVNKQLVREWEMGLAVPTRPQLKRLINLVSRELRFFSYLLPEEMRHPPKVEPADPDEAYVALLPSEEPPPELEKPLPEPKTFPEALRRARLDEGLHQRELAELIGTGQASLSRWELGQATPSLQHYERLVNLFPALALVPRPEGMRSLSEPAPAPAPAPKPAPTPLPSPTPPPDTVDSLGIAYARALAQVERLKLEAKALRDRIREIEAQTSDAEAAANEAREKLLSTVGRAA